MTPTWETFLAGVVVGVLVCPWLIGSGIIRRELHEMLSARNLSLRKVRGDPYR
jgi:hypothetical protein